MWTATISLDGQAPIHVDGADRDRVVAQALAYLPDAAHDAIARALAWRPDWLWLMPSRTGTWPGASVVVTAGRAVSDTSTS